MQIRPLLLAGTILGAALGVAGSASAQTASEQIKAQQAQIDYMKRQIELMQQKLQDMQTQAQATQQQVAAVASPAKPQPKVVQSASNKFSIESADGQYSIGLTGRIHLDAAEYLNVSPANKAVGPQDLASGFNARRARIGVTGKVAGDWTYGFIYDGGGTSDATASGIQTAQVGYNGFKNTTIEFGYSDTFFTLDEATSSNDILFLERATPGVVATAVNTGDFRSNFGARYMDDRFWLGAYVTGPMSLQAHGVGESLGAYERATVQVLQDPNYSLHLGVGVDEIIKAPNAGPLTPNTFTLSDRPELRVDPTALLSTGALGTLAHPVSGGYILDLEAAAGYQSLFFQGEYLHFDVERTGLKAAEFDGEYGEVSYVLTGESHKYNKATGAYGGVTPAHVFSMKDGGWGAWEVAARVSYIDLNDNFIPGLTLASQPNGVDGGKQTNFTFGLNWYPNTYMRFMLNYIHTDYDKANPSAVAGAPLGVAVGTGVDALAFRTQVAW